MTGTLPTSIVGMGDPVMDILARVSHEYLETITKEPGGCTPVLAEEMEGLQKRTAVEHELKRIPGGSAANVMKGLANLSRRTWPCKFMGMVAQDSTGSEYRTKLAAQGVQPLLLTSSSGAPSASALCLVSPDGQRTMRTCLGASLELNKPEQLPQGWSNSLTLLHCEGYCLYRAAFTQQVMKAAKQQGALVSIDLASFELVRHCKQGLLHVLSSGVVDIIFANEEEAATLAVELELTDASASHDAKVEAAQNFLLKHVKVSFVSMGAKGCMVRDSNGVTASSDAAKVKVVDTIGAGDCFTAGCLYAYLQGADLATCAKVGCAAGAQAVQAEGAELDDASWDSLHEQVKRLLDKARERAREERCEQQLRQWCDKVTKALNSIGITERVVKVGSVTAAVIMTIVAARKKCRS